LFGVKRRVKTRYGELKVFVTSCGGFSSAGHERIEELCGADQRIIYPSEMLEHRTDWIYEESISEKETTGMVRRLITFNLDDYATNRSEARERILNITLSIGDHIIAFL
jgi:hypothetical protein